MPRQTRDQCIFVIRGKMMRNVHAYSAATADGGGVTGQAGALRLGIARALVKIDERYHPMLKSRGLLTRDPRMKERKKYGLAGSRKRFQFSKR